MAKATAEVTIYQSQSVRATYRYYLLASTKPSKPTTYPPATTWVAIEPSYTEGSTNYLYFVDCTVLSDGSFIYSEVSISSAYEAAKLAYNKALAAEATASSTSSALAAWCHANNKTLIDGSKIYTGTITADKLAVNSLQAISANVGGFSISDKGLYKGTTSISSTKEGVYLGNDGIKTADGDGWTTIVGNRIVTGWNDSQNTVETYAHGIDLQSFGDTIDIYPQRIQFYNDEYEQLMINYQGIYDARWSTAEPLLGVGDEPGSTYLGHDTELYGDFSLYGNLYMYDEGYIGTKAHPTGSHVIANNKFIYGLNTNGVSEKLIGLSDSNNMIIGSTDGLKGNIFTYIGAGSSFSVNGTEGYIFGTFISDDDGIRTFKCVPVYDKTTTGGTAVRVGTSGVLARYTSSSMRYKEEITLKLDDSLNPERLYDLGVYQYKYRDGHISKNDQRYGMTHIGFIAEDVKHKYPIAANYNDDGEVEDWSERYIIPAMLKLIQTQHKEIQSLKEAFEKGKINEDH